MLIDAAPTKDGNLILSQTSDGAIVAQVAKTGFGPPGELRFVSHFSTCSSAAQFRRPRKRSGALRLP
jgi:hypothetical protein